MSFSAPSPLAKTLYSSGAAEAAVTGANTRLTMLPVDVKTGNSSFYIPAGILPIGSQIRFEGIGTIGARSVGPPGFNFIPWVQADGGSKIDLPGFAMAPLLGTDGTCEVWLHLVQLTSGLRTGGVVRYGMVNGMAYSIVVNPGGTGTSGALPTVVTSDPNIGRTFGIDGFWGGGADTREYVRCRSVTAILVT